MEKFNLNNFFKGWFIGNFEPSLLKTNDFEISIKRYSIHDHEERHFHKLATEYTIIVDGVVEMNGVLYHENDIIKIEPNESTDFKCLTDVTTVVIKTPCVKDDKFLGERRIYNIEVGAIKDEDVKDYIEKIKEQFKKPNNNSFIDFKLKDLDSDITYYNIKKCKICNILLDENNDDILEIGICSACNTNKA